MWDHRLVKVGDDYGAKVDVAGRANVSRFQAELDLGGILVQVIRTLGQLGDGDWELAVDAVVSSVLRIEPAGTEEEAHQAVVFIRFEDRFQIKGGLPIGFSAVEDSGIVSVLLLSWGIS